MRISDIPHIVATSNAAHDARGRMLSVVYGLLERLEDAGCTDDVLNMYEHRASIVRTLRSEIPHVDTTLVDIFMLPEVTVTLVNHDAVDNDDPIKKVMVTTTTKTAASPKRKYDAIHNGYEPLLTDSDGSEEDEDEGDEDEGDEDEDDDGDDDGDDSDDNDAGGSDDDSDYEDDLTRVLKAFEETSSSMRCTSLVCMVFNALFSAIAIGAVFMAVGRAC